MQVTQYLRFFLMVPLVLLTTAGILAGGPWMWTGLVVTVVGVLAGDALMPEDLSVPVYHRPFVLKVLLFSMLPLIALMLYALAWMVTPGDPLYFGAYVNSVLGVDLLQSKQETGWIDWVGGLLSATLLVGIAATNVAHELLHSPDRFAPTMARLLLTFSFDWPLVVSHIYGHHVLVGTERDNTTARRGESSYAFVYRSTVRGQLHAWRVEVERLQRMQRSWWSWGNGSLRGYVASTLATALFWAATGWQGALTFVVCAVLAKALLELINYIQHYGLLRVPDRPVAARHSWSCNKSISSYLLCNVTRHAHHHLEGEMPFWRLQPTTTDGPVYPYGYMALILLALVPPLWHRAMAPRLLTWDQRWATTGERQLARSANAASRVSRLRAATA